MKKNSGFLLIKITLFDSILSVWTPIVLPFFCGCEEWCPYWEKLGKFYKFFCELKNISRSDEFFSDVWENCLYQIFILTRDWDLVQYQEETRFLKWHCDFYKWVLKNELIIYMMNERKKIWMNMNLLHNIKNMN